jgi:hypothetical protein
MHHLCVFIVVPFLLSMGGGAVPRNVAGAIGTISGFVNKTEPGTKIRLPVNGDWVMAPGWVDDWPFDTICAKYELPYYLEREYTSVATHSAVAIPKIYEIQRNLTVILNYDCFVDFGGQLIKNGKIYTRGCQVGRDSWCRTDPEKMQKSPCDLATLW